jgi:hypothetical protein
MRCAAISTTPMPVVLDPTSWPLWLGEEPAKPDDLKAMLVPYPSAAMTCWPISKVFLAPGFGYPQASPLSSVADCGRSQDAGSCYGACFFETASKRLPP